MPSDETDPPGVLPEPFAPTGPRLSRFAIRPAPPILPRLFPDEARFAVRLSLLVFGTELAAWGWIAALLAGAQPAQRGQAALAALGLGGLRLLRPLWARAGARIPRNGLAFALLCLALIGDGAALLAPPVAAFPTGVALAAVLCCGLPALGDVAASCVADAVTVERRAAAFSWLEMGQALGAALGLGLGASAPRYAPVIAAAGLFLTGLGISDLRDRGTPRSAWPLALYAEAARTPLGRELVALAFAIGGLAGLVLPAAPAAAFLAPIAGLIFVARAEPRAPNAVVLPRLLAGVALLAALVLLAEPRGPRLAAFAAAQLALLALGAAASALPAAVARAAPELTRPVCSSLVSSALFTGLCAAAALGVVFH
ncbi:MAG: hypothetical protein NVS4B10_01000 [Myxococcales bacterium]